MTTRKDPPVSSRTLRRTERRLETQLTGLSVRIETLRLDVTRERSVFASDPAVRTQLAAFRSEVGERLAQIEGQLAGIVDHFRIPLLPRWTPEQREAFRRGEAERDAATDHQLREAFRSMNGDSALENPDATRMPW